MRCGIFVRVLLACGAALTVPSGQAQPEVWAIDTPGLKKPGLLRKTEPVYSAEGTRRRIQGTVQLEIVVDETGKARDIKVLSSLGFGLDERAVAAIEQWAFTPGVKDGKPVRVRATAEVNFRIPGRAFNEKVEHQRTIYNESLADFAAASPSRKSDGIKAILKLANEKFPPAMHMVGLWKISGQNTDKDPTGGLAFLQEAAKKDYPAALYEIADRQIRGVDLPRNSKKGLDLMKRAAQLESDQAQFALGSFYEVGQGVPSDSDLAAKYFRMCAAGGTALCQFRLGNLLVRGAARSERDTIEAVAWYQLAAEQNIQGAKEAAGRESQKLTPTQLAAVISLKANLVQK